MPTRTTKSPLHSISLDREGKQSMQVQIFDQVRRSILSGQLKPGTRLPATRILATELSVSRNTILGAFERLHAEGYIEGRMGAGTRVSKVLPEDLLNARHISCEQKLSANPAGKLSSLSLHSANTDVETHPCHQEMRAFRPGLPDISQFPFQLWSQMIGKFWKNPPANLLFSGDMGGYIPLRTAIAAYLGAVRDVHCSPEQVIITSGAQQALDLVARVIIDPGDDVWLEDPGYPGLKSTLMAAGGRINHIPVDEQGLSVAHGHENAPRAVLAAVTPSHQYPLGVTMSLARRLELLDWATRNNAWILEDDYDSEFRYAGKPLSALQGLDETGRVIYVGTFSKVLFPSLRLGYVVVPEPMLAAFRAVRSAIDDYPALALQPALHSFIDEGHFASHIRKQRRIYSERQDMFIRALQRHANGLLSAAPAEAGMHLIVELDPARGLHDKQVSTLAYEAGLIAPALSAFYDEAPGKQGLVLGYAGLNEFEINRDVKRLVAALTSTTTG